MILPKILQLLFIFLIPALMLYAEKRLRIVAWLGPVILCYVVGMLVGNTPGIALDLPLMETFTELSAILAVPLVLFSADLRRWVRLAPKTILSFTFCVAGAIVSTLTAFYFLGDQLPEAWKMAGMTIGVYTGGTPNLNAIGMALSATPELIAKANVADFFVSVPYLIVLFTVAHRLFLLFLPKFQSDDKAFENESEGFRSLPVKKKGIHVGLSLLLAGGCLGLALGLAALSGWEEQGALIIVSVTLLGLLLSFIKPVRELVGTYETGEYLLLVFCVAMGSQLQFAKLSQDVPTMVAFMAIAVYGAIGIHLLAAYLFRIDADTVIVTSVAALFSPIFIPPIAKVLRNREIIASGMTTGIIGFAIGNFAGLVVAYALQ